MYVTTQDYSFAAGLLAQPATALSSEQIATLAEEIEQDPTQRGYAGLPAPTVHTLLHGIYGAIQPAAWTPKELVTGRELRDWITPLKSTLRFSSASDELKTTWLGIMGDWQGISDTYTFDPATSSMWQGLVAQSAGLLDGDNVRVISLESIRDLTHTYRPATVEMVGPRVVELLGAGVVLTLAEVEALL